MKKLLSTVAMIALITAGAAHAQTTPTTTAPAPVTSPSGVNQVDQRLQNQQDRIDNGVKDGQIGAKQEMRDDARDNRVSTEMSKDEAKNGGTVTKREQTRMNKQLNKDSKKIHRQRKLGTETNGASAH